MKKTRKSKAKPPLVLSHKPSFIQEANRMKRLPPYLFTVVDQIKKEVVETGVDVVDLSMGSPDLPPPKHVIDAMKTSLMKPEIHRYSKWTGDTEKRFRKAISNWYKMKFNVDLCPETEVLPLIGSKEGIAHLCLAFMNNDDLALVPSPAYPVHFNGVIMAGGILYNIPTFEEHNWIPDLFTLPRETVRLSKLLFLSYPHNPTTAVVDSGFFEKVIHWARGKDLIVTHDFAYSDFMFGKEKAPSILQTKGSRDFSIEIHTMSKSYCMSGWRVGFAVGNRDVLEKLRKTKSYCDFGLFRAVQEGSIAALTGPQSYVTKLVKTYEKRLQYFTKGLNAIGWPVTMPKSTFYLWARIPLKYSALSSLEFTELMLREAGVAVIPGTGFGDYGEGYIRFAMVEPEERMAMALKRIKALLDRKD
jgi:aspartate/methionine/tyrosine aminotransferase